MSGGTSTCASWSSTCDSGAASSRRRDHMIIIMMIIMIIIMMIMIIMIIVIILILIQLMILVLVKYNSNSNNMNNHIIITMIRMHDMSCMTHTYNCIVVINLRLWCGKLSRRPSRIRVLVSSQATKLM